MMLRVLVMCITIGISFPNSIHSQSILDQLHGDQNYSYDGLHAGNQIRVSLSSDCMVGQRKANPDDFAGEWPINTGQTYINSIVFFVDSEGRDVNNEFKIIVSEGNAITTGGEIGQKIGKFAVIK